MKSRSIGKMLLIVVMGSLAAWGCARDDRGGGTEGGHEHGEQGDQAHAEETARGSLRRVRTPARARRAPKIPLDPMRPHEE